MNGAEHLGPSRGPWVVVVPQKDLALAKSRLALLPDARELVAEAMFRDTLSCVAQASLVQAAVVVTDRARDAELVRAPGVVPLVRPDAGTLNRALQVGASHARTWWSGCRVVALPSDLPCMRAETLDLALDAAARHVCSAFVADARRKGTTLLAAGPGQDLDPRYGGSSRIAHLRAGAAELRDPWLEPVRCDVDDLNDLLSVADRVHGPHLARALRVLGFSHDPLLRRYRMDAELRGAS